MMKAVPRPGTTHPECHRTHHRPEGSCAQNVRKLPPAEAASKSSFYFYMHISNPIIFIFYTPFK